MQEAGYRCKRCGETKPPAAFSPNSRTKTGLASFCKPCSAEKSREWRQANPDKVREQSRAKYARIRAERPEAHRERITRWRRENRDYTNLMTRANLAIFRAVARGKVERPSACESCGAEGAVEAHHEDHSKYLDVDWLCRRCHRAADKQRKSDGRART